MNLGVGNPGYLMASTGLEKFRDQNRGGGSDISPNFHLRRNMCKAEGEYYITAADRHWRTDGELRAVAEVHQITSTFLST